MMISQLLRLYEELAMEYMRQGRNSDLELYLEPRVFDKMRDYVREITRFSLPNAHPITEDEIQYYTQAGRITFRRVQPVNAATTVSQVSELINAGILSRNEVNAYLSTTPNWSHVDLTSHYTIPTRGIYRLTQPDGTTIDRCLEQGDVVDGTTRPFRYGSTMHTAPECYDCSGGGFIGRLYPSGHSEVRCETCNGTGVLD